MQLRYTWLSAAFFLHTRLWSALPFESKAPVSASVMYRPGAHVQVGGVEDDPNTSLDEDPVFERPGELVPDSGIFETDAEHTVLDAAVDTHGRGGRVTCGGRVVHQPYDRRDDMGFFGIYMGNLSGHRRLKLVNDHIAADLIARNPAQVLIAQEVDPHFIECLRETPRAAPRRCRRHTQ